MNHQMKLLPEPFAAVAAGYKTVELRLNDEKRRAVHAGDTVTFRCIGQDSQSVTKAVTDIQHFPDFTALYEAVPLLKCGYTPFTLRDASPADMDAYYSREQQRRDGVLAIMLEEQPLQRFLAGQSGAMADCSGYAAALAEIRSGLKRTHWIWYVLPQLRGLTKDRVTEYYALENRAEAMAFLSHPLLGNRLREICAALTALDASDPVAVFGETDAYKLRQSMTLFDAIAPEETLFAAVLEQYCLGTRDADTLRLLRYDRS